LIRHAVLGSALPVRALAVAMIEPAFRALLMPQIGGSPLPAPGSLPTGAAAIAVPAVAMRADEEQCPAFAAETNLLTENRFAMSRHACAQAALDNGDGFVSL
jgi:hypothetical protein